MSTAGCTTGGTGRLLHVPSRTHQAAKPIQKERGAYNPYVALFLVCFRNAGSASVLYLQFGQ
jgi:hypothetical protein